MEILKIKSRKLLFIVVAIISMLSGNAGAIKVAPGRLDHFNMNVPEKIIAGESFVIKMMALDSYGNLITAFSETGMEVTLSASRPATINPMRLSPALFEGGVANVTVTVRNAGNLSIYISDFSTGKKIQHLDISVDRTPGQTENAAEPLRNTGKASELRKTVSRPSETDKKETATKPAGKDITKKSLNKKTAATDVSKHRETQKTASLPAANTNEPAKKIPENRKGEKLFSISDISILEAGEKALLVIKSPSPAETPEYRKTLETRQGRKVIRIRLKPAVRNTDSIVKLQSELIGNIYVEEDLKDHSAINLLIELKTAHSFSDIVTQKNALIVMIASKKF